MSFLEKLDYVLTAAYTLLKGSTDTALREKIVATVVGLVTGTGINDVYNSGLMDPEWLKEATPGQIVGTLLEIFLKKVEEASVFGMAKAAAGQALELSRGRRSRPLRERRRGWAARYPPAGTVVPEGLRATRSMCKLLEALTVKPVNLRKHFNVDPRKFRVLWRIK
jgi:hypothetical protein